MIFNDLAEIRKYAMPTDWWTKYFLHPFSIRFVRVIKYTKVKPNHLTLLSTLIVLLTLPLICWGGYFLLVTTAFFLQLGLMLDCADGQLARYKKIFSPFGGWLDQVTDRVKDFSIIFSITYRYSQVNEKAWILGFISFFIIFMLDYFGQQNRALPGYSESEAVDKLETGFIGKLKYIKRKLRSSFFGIGEQYFFYTVFLILNRIDILFYLIIIYGGLAVIWKPLNAYREYILLKRKKS